MEAYELLMEANRQESQALHQKHFNDYRQYLDDKRTFEILKSDYAKGSDNLVFHERERIRLFTQPPPTDEFELRKFELDKLEWRANELDRKYYCFKYEQSGQI